MTRVSQTWDQQQAPSAGASTAAQQMKPCARASQRWLAAAPGSPDTTQVPWAAVAVVL